MGSLTTLYTDKAIDYLKNRRDPKKPFALYVAHTMMHTIINASERFRGTSAGDLYGDVVEEFDYETGRLLDVVDELGLRGNTLVIYTSDNGPWNQDKYTKKKKGHPEGSISGAMLDLCAMGRVLPTREVTDCPASYGGLKRSRQAEPRTPSLQRLTSCQRLQHWLVTQCQAIGTLTVWTRQISCWANAKQAESTSISRGPGYVLVSGNI